MPARAREFRATEGLGRSRASSRAPAARRRSICARTTSPIWASRDEVGAPVLLVADIDRGGVIAQLVGCKAVLDADDAAIVKGFIVNKFRGDPSLFDDGMRLIAERTGWRALGLLPFFDGRVAPAGRGRFRPARLA